MTIQRPNSFRTGPDERGHFGIYGGRFVAETLMPLILELEKAYADAKADAAFRREMDGHLKNYVGRPSPLYFAERLTAHFGGAKIYFKREDMQDVFSFKVRGAYNKMANLSDAQLKRGVICASAGNHALGLSWHGRALGISVTVVMPRFAPLVKVARCRQFGATVVLHGDTFEEAREEANRFVLYQETR